jgi:hypothetical protein
MLIFENINKLVAEISRDFTSPSEFLFSLEGFKQDILSHHSINEYLQRTTEDFSDSDMSVMLSYMASQNTITMNSSDPKVLHYLWRLM